MTDLTSWHWLALGVLGCVLIVGLVVAVLLIEARAIDRAGDRFDITPTDPFDGP